MSSGLPADVADWWNRHAERELRDDAFAQVDIDDLCDDPPALAAAAG